MTVMQKTLQQHVVLMYFGLPLCFYSKVKKHLLSEQLFTSFIITGTSTAKARSGIFFGYTRENTRKYLYIYFTNK